MRPSRAMLLSLFWALAGLLSCHGGGDPSDDGTGEQIGAGTGPISDWPEHTLDAGAPPGPGAGPGPGEPTGAMPGGAGGVTAGGGATGGATPSFDAGAGGGVRFDSGVSVPSFDAGAVPRDAAAGSVGDTGQADAAVDAAPDARD